MGNVVYLFGDPSAPQQPSRGQRRPLGPLTPPNLKTWKKALIFYVSYGRNAWHSTWIRRYKTGQFAASEALSREYVNTNLKQGSTYTLKTLPAIVVDFGRFRAIVAEINTNAPFGNVRAECFEKQLEVGTASSEFQTMMNPASECWTDDQSRQNSIIVQRVQTPIGEFVEFSDEINHPRKNISGLGDWVRLRDGAHWWWAICDENQPLLREMNLTAFQALGTNQGAEDVQP